MPYYIANDCSCSAEVWTVDCGLCGLQLLGSSVEQMFKISMFSNTLEDFERYDTIPSNKVPNK